MLEHVQQLDNEEMLNACNVEDWLNLENELLTSPQMSDEEILATVVGDLMESQSVCSDEEGEGEDENQYRLKRLHNVSKNAFHGWNHRMILTFCS